MDANAFVQFEKKGKQKILREAFQDISQKVISAKETNLLNSKNTAVSQRIINRVKDDLKGLRVLDAGDTIENLTFKEPSNLSVFENSITFLNNPHQKSVQLNDILKENSGVCVIATCTEINKGM